MYYNDYFKSIYLKTKPYLTTFILGKKGKGDWIHAVRAYPKKKKGRRKK